LNIKHLGDGRFEMESMSGQKMTVNQNELSQLVLIAKDYVDHIQRVSSRAQMMSTVPVTSGTVGIDMHHTYVILRLQHEGLPNK
jgi:hypothetical protein